VTDPGARPSFADYTDSGWEAGLFRIAAIAMLGAGFAAGPVVLVSALGGPNLAYVLWIALAAGAVAVVTTDTLARPDRRGRRGPAVRLGELVLLLVVIRVVVWSVRGFPELTELRGWLASPGLFFNGEFLAAGFITGVAWLVALLTAGDFFELRIHADEVAAQQSRTWGDAASQWRAFRPVERAEVLRGFARRWLGMGMLLVLFVAVSRVGIMQNERKLLQFVLRDTGLPLPILAGVLLYFLAGLLLMSHGRLAVLRGSWYNQGVRIAPHLAQRWHAVTAAGLLVVGGVALLLPLGATGGLAAVLNQVLAFAWRLALWLVGLLHALFALLVLLFQGSSVAEETAPTEQLPLLQAIPTQQQAVLQLPPWLGGVVLWLVVVLLGGYLLVRFLSTSAFNQTAAGKLWLRLSFWWRARTHAFGVAVNTRARWLRKRMPRIRREPPDRSPLIERHARTPRDRVRVYYLRTVREASNRGVVRLPQETPVEYARDLAATWPEADADVQALTDAFVEARYSKEEIDAVKEGKVQVMWRRVTQALARKPERP
jgi:hypothetical protein